jgi:hypothetical protein
MPPDGPPRRPVLFGLYTVVTLRYQGLPESRRSGAVRWPGKVGITFSDALTAVRLWPWREWVFPQAGGAAGIEEPPSPIRDVLLYTLAPAA